MTTSNIIDTLFEHRASYPDFEKKERLDRLVGLDDKKDRLAKMIGMLIDKTRLKRWLEHYHPESDLNLDNLLRRPPLVVLSGDVGSGKTELAETIGDLVARQNNIDLMLFPLSLSTRGQGRVGEMTQLLASAFDYTVKEAEKLKSQTSSKARGGIILLIDEADALAQSRENAQMHHEDRAGVNAFIRGIDRIANAQLPVVVIMCTNRLSALDPAVRRRAADILTFHRPDEIQRRSLLEKNLAPLNVSSQDIDRLIEITGGKNNYSIPYTFSDITHRLIPNIILNAFPSKSVNGSDAISLAEALMPTPPFQDKSIV